MDVSYWCKYPSFHTTLGIFYAMVYEHNYFQTEVCKMIQGKRLSTNEQETFMLLQRESIAINAVKLHLILFLKLWIYRPWQINRMNTMKWLKLFMLLFPVLLAQLEVNKRTDSPQLYRTFVCLLSTTFFTVDLLLDTLGGRVVIWFSIQKGTG